MMRKRLCPIAADNGFTEVEKLYIANYSIPLEGVEAPEEVFYESFMHNKTMLVNDMAWLKRKFSQSLEFIDRVKPPLLYCQPH